MTTVSTESVRPLSPSPTLPVSPSCADAIAHESEPTSNEIRARLAAVEPVCLRTFTPSLAVLAKSAGSYHWTPEGASSRTLRPEYW